MNSEKGLVTLLLRFSMLKASKQRSPVWVGPRIHLLDFLQFYFALERGRVQVKRQIFKGEEGLSNLVGGFESCRGCKETREGFRQHHSAGWFEF